MHASAPFGKIFFFFIQNLSEIGMPSALPRRYDVVLFVRLGTDHAIARIVRVFVPVLLFLFHDSPCIRYSVYAASYLSMRRGSADIPCRGENPAGNTPGKIFSQNA